MSLNGHISGWLKVSNGVLKGSILGPLHFTMFIDGIDEEVLCEISLLMKQK